MMTLRLLPGYQIPTSAVWLLTDIAEHKGRHQLFARQSPQALKALLQMALVQSAESSNRIEGVTVEPARCAHWCSAAQDPATVPSRRSGVIGERSILYTGSGRSSASMSRP